MKFAPILVAGCLLLGACETATTYQAATAPAAVGYTEQRIEPGRYRVTFQGGEGPPQQVQDYALLRAAEIAVRDGYDWFRITDRFEDARPPRSGATVSFGGASFGRHSGFGVGTSYDLSGGPVARSSIEVLMGHGPKPGGPDAYDARGVIATIGPRAAPPPHAQ
jgi:hypothetical protein